MDIEQKVLKPRSKTNTNANNSNHDFDIINTEDSKENFANCEYGEYTGLYLGAKLECTTENLVALITTRR